MLVRMVGRRRLVGDVGCRQLIFVFTCHTAVVVVVVVVVLVIVVGEGDD